jgi:hypothetical protein
VQPNAIRCHSGRPDATSCVPGVSQPGAQCAPG